MATIRATYDVDDADIGRAWRLASDTLHPNATQEQNDKAREVCLEMFRKEIGRIAQLAFLEGIQYGKRNPSG